MSIQMIPFNKLVASPLNMRIKSASKKEDEQLYANIKAEGVLKNLLVVPTETGDQFEVVGGGRRLRQITRLVTEGHWSDDQPVPCRVSSREKAQQLTIAENLHAATHPADDFNAYKELADTGKDVKEIAAIFGHSVKQVEKLMRLGRVHPTLVQLFRDDKLSQESVTAFAVCDDQERQIACYNELKRSYIHPNAVRNFLMKNTYKSTDGIVRFVTLKAYKKAGGTVTNDLFQDTVFLNEVAIVEDLANQKLAATIEEFSGDGWHWVESSLGDFCPHDSSYKRLSAELIGVPDSLLAEIAALEERVEELEYSDEDLTPEQEQELESGRNKLDELETQRDEYLAYSPEQKAFSGVVVTFEDTGALKVYRGIVKKADWASLAAATDKSLPDGGIQAVQGIESNALTQDLRAYHTQAFRASLLQNPALCLDIFIFDMACSVFLDWADKLIAISSSPYETNAVGIEETAAFKILEDGRAALNLGWVDVEDDAEQFNDFLALTADEKNAILTYCIATTANALVRNPSVQQEHAALKMDFNMLSFWRPTAENYFSRINKAALVDIASPRLGEDWTKASASKKRGALAAEVADAPEMADWLPDSLSGIYAADDEGEGK